MVKKMKDYVITRGTFLDKIGHRSAHSRNSRFDASPGPLSRPIVSSFSLTYAAPIRFAAMKWRLVEVTAARTPAL